MDVAFGNASELVETAALLEKIDANILRDYQAKTGASAEQIKQWMDNETWFTAQEALTSGFVDRIYGKVDAPAEGEPEDKKAAAKLTTSKRKTLPKIRARLQRVYAVNVNWPWSSGHIAGNPQNKNSQWRERLWLFPSRICGNRRLTSSRRPRNAEQGQFYR